MALILGLTIGKESVAFGAALIFVASLFDASHIGVTVWRTWLYKAELKRAMALYVALPTSLFFIGLIIQMWSIPALLSILTYAVLFHVMRQNYGIYRWYEYLNRRHCEASRAFLYLLMTIPVVIAHTPQKSFGGIFSSTSFFKISSFEYYEPLLGMYFVVLLLWLAHEIKLLKSGVREINRFLAVAFPAVLYGFAFLEIESWSGQMTAIITAHAFQYFSLTGLSVHRTQPQRFGAWHRYLLYFGGSSVVAIVFYAYTIDSALNPAGLFSDYLAVGLRALFFTVTFSHYLIDGVIWRHRHWENSLVYTRV